MIESLKAQASQSVEELELYEQWSHFVINYHLVYDGAAKPEGIHY